MRCGEVFPSNIIPIKNVNEEELWKVGRFAVEVYNKNGEHLIYLRVVNGLSYTINEVESEFLLLW